VALLVLAAAGAGAAQPSSGCGTRTVSGELTLAVAGHRRVVIVHLPSGYTSRARLALVVSLHGSGSTAAAQGIFSGMDATADADGFIVAYPQGMIRAGSGYDWDIPGQPRLGSVPAAGGAPNDVAFVTDLVGVMESKYCIDPARVYATGFSGGARLASQLACDSAGVFAAVAAVSGLRHATPCPASRPVPIVAIHGNADPVDPYDGNGQGYWTYSVPQAAADWASQDGCAPSASSTRRGRGVTLTSYRRCRAGASVELYTINGEGHEWPGGPVLPRSVTRLLGPQSTALDANATIWAFFRAHPLR